MTRVDHGSVWLGFQVPELRAVWLQSTSEVELVDMVPCRRDVEFHVAREDSETLLGVWVEATGQLAPSVDRFLRRYVGRDLAQAVRTMVGLPQSGTAEPRVFSVVDDDVETKYLRLRYLMSLVSRPNWDRKGNSVVWNELSQWLEIPGVSDETIADVQDMFAEFDLGDTKEKRAIDWIKDLASGGNLFDRYNAVPRRRGLTFECQEVLFAVCLDGDNLRSVVNESLVHASLVCQETKAIILLTTKWDPNTWLDLEEEIASWPTYAVVLKGPNGNVARLF